MMLLLLLEQIERARVFALCIATSMCICIGIDLCVGVYLPLSLCVCVCRVHNKIHLEHGQTWSSFCLCIPSRYSSRTCTTMSGIYFINLMLSTTEYIDGVVLRVLSIHALGSSALSLSPSFVHSRRTRFARFGLLHRVRGACVLLPLFFFLPALTVWCDIIVCVLVCTFTGLRLCVHVYVCVCMCKG